MGLALTVGILVDDSIVVLENIARHLKLGETPEQAAINGRSEIGMAAIAITLVDVVVFTPVAFMSGFMGAIFRTSAWLSRRPPCFRCSSLSHSHRSWPAGGTATDRARPASHTKARVTPWQGSLASGTQGIRGWSAATRGSCGGPCAGAGWSSPWRSFRSPGGLSLVTLGILPSEGMPRDDAGQLTVTVEMHPARH